MKKDIVVFGAGNNAAMVIFMLKKYGYKIVALFDNDLNKIGKCVSYDIVCEKPKYIPNTNVVISVKDKTIANLIKEQCKAIGYKEFIDIDFNDIYKETHSLKGNELIEYNEFIHSVRNGLGQLLEDGIAAKVPSIAENPQKHIMLIQRRNKMVGTFSDYLVFLVSIDYAIKQGYIPVIDRRSIKTYYFPTPKNVNSWEVFFEQPFNISISDIDYSSMDVVISPAEIGGLIWFKASEKRNDIDQMKYWRTLASKYIRFRPELKNQMDKKSNDILKGKRTLGVSVREGYMLDQEKNRTRIEGHPIQRNPAFLINLLDDYIREWNCDQIFFTCQTSEVVEMFKNKFGDKAICIDRKRYIYDKMPESKDPETMYDDQSYEEIMQNETDYVTEMFILSKCNSFLCSSNSGSEAVLLMSEGFENVDCLNDGIFHVNEHREPNK